MYLYSLLESPAIRAVAGLKLAAANYNEQLMHLKTFGNKQQIIWHMYILLELESVAIHW